MRRFFAVPFLLLLLGASPANATLLRGTAETVPTNLTQTVTTAHFAVHYTDAAGDPNASSAAAVQTLAANAEGVYAVEVGQWGYTAPYDGNGDGHLDIYVFTLDGAFTGAAGVAWFRGYFPGEPIIWIDTRYTWNKSVIAHEFFHALQFTIFPWGKWGSEATARWAEHQLKYPDEFKNDYGYLQHTDAPLDCEYGACPPGVWDGGYERWLFFGYLSDLYGAGVIKEIFQDNRSKHDANKPVETQSKTIDSVLLRHGSSLTRTFGEFAAANAARSYASVKPSSIQVKTLPLSVSGSAATTVAVEHLAAKYLQLRAGNTACVNSSLNVSVTLPVGLSFAALVVGGAVTPLSVGAGVATATIPWATCSGEATLVLPNGLLSGGAVSFAVQVTVGDSGAVALPPVAPTGPPADPAPTLRMLGLPAVLRVSSRKPVLSLSISSNAPGTLTAALDGGAVIGTFAVRPGTNKFKLIFPRGLKGQRTLVLTSVSPSGAPGQTFRQQLVFAR